MPRKKVVEVMEAPPQYNEVHEGDTYSTEPYTSDTVDLTQTETYRNLEWYMQRATTAIDVNDDEKWARRSNSFRDMATSMLLMSVALAFTLGIIYTALKYIVVDIIQTGVAMYNFIAPLALLLVIGYFYRGYRDRK